MGGGDQFLRVGALLVLEAGLERIGRGIEYTGIGCEVAGAVSAGAVPDSLCFADHLRLLFPIDRMTLSQRKRLDTGAGVPVLFQSDQKRTAREIGPCERKDVS